MTNTYAIKTRLFPAKINYDESVRLLCLSVDRVQLLGEYYLVIVLKDWTMVYLFGMPDGSEPEQRWGRVVTGTVVIDGSQQCQPGTYLCSDPISRSPGTLAQTHTGQSFSLFGQGKEIELPVTHLDKLRAGIAIDSILADSD